MNQIIVSGRLTANPEIASTASGSTIARFTVAVNRRFAKEGQQKADFFSCNAYGKQAEFAEKYLNKGTKVEISGEMRLDIVQKDGKNVTYPKISINEIEFAESKKTQDSSDGFVNIPDSINPDELPFS